MLIFSANEQSKSVVRPILKYSSTGEWVPTPLAPHLHPRSSPQKR